MDKHLLTTSQNSKVASPKSLSNISRRKSITATTLLLSTNSKLLNTSNKQLSTVNMFPSCSSSTLMSTTILLKSLITTVASTNKLHEADKLALIRVAASQFIACPSLAKEVGMPTTLFLKGVSVVVLPTRTSKCHHLHVPIKAPTGLSSTQTIRPRSQPIDPRSQSVGPAVIILSQSMKVGNAILSNSRVASPITSPIVNLSAKARIMVSPNVNPIMEVHTMRHGRIKTAMAVAEPMAEHVTEPTAEHVIDPTGEHVAEDTEDEVDMEDTAPTYGLPPEVEQTVLAVDVVEVVRRLPRRAKAL
ncbi:MAG: hypothetical protein Q9176_004548 [Flavoplaca citrina]